MLICGMVDGGFTKHKWECNQFLSRHPCRGWWLLDCEIVCLIVSHFPGLFPLTRSGRCLFSIANMGFAKRKGLPIAMVLLLPCGPRRVPCHVNFYRGLWPQPVTMICKYFVNGSPGEKQPWHFSLRPFQEIFPMQSKKVDCWSFHVCIHSFLIVWCHCSFSLTRSAGGHSFYFQRADVEFDLPDTGLEQVHQEGEEEEACSDPFHCNWSSTAAHTHMHMCIWYKIV